MNILDTSSLNKFDFDNLIDDNSFVFRLTGGLGNQLFGLSEAYGIQRETNKRAYIDISKIEHTEKSRSSLLWANDNKLDGNFTLINLTGSNFVEDCKFNNISQTQTSRYNRYLTGWVPSYNRIIKNGLWIPGEAPNFMSFFKEDTIENIIHIRLGDYKYTKPFKPLPQEYYIRSIAKLNLINEEIHLFSDDPESILDFYPIFSKYNAKIRFEIDLAKTLFMLAKSQKYITSNSTFGFWGYYFGNHRSITVPKPFYDFKPSFCEDLWSVSHAKSKKLYQVPYISLSRSLSNSILDILKKFKNLLVKNIQIRNY